MFIDDDFLRWLSFSYTFFKQGNSSWFFASNISPLTRLKCIFQIQLHWAIFMCAIKSLTINFMFHCQLASREISGKKLTYVYHFKPRREGVAMWKCTSNTGRAMTNGIFIGHKYVFLNQFHPQQGKFDQCFEVCWSFGFCFCWTKVTLFVPKVGISDTSFVW